MSQINPDLRVEQFDYDVPHELIAQTPLKDREASRLLVIERGSANLTHHRVRDLAWLLRAGDLVVVNNTRVMAGRLHGARESGGRVELLLLRRNERGWLALAKPAKRLRDGETVRILPADRAEGHGGSATVLAHLEDGLVQVELSVGMEAELEHIGVLPLPPYIHERLEDPQRYQTVYGTALGSAAAPTAGLHLTRELFARLQDAGMGIGYATLHVGLDTFRPVTVERVSDHVIHREWCEVSLELAGQIEATRRAGGRVVAIGTTTARTLETFGSKLEEERAGGWSGWTDIFITPGYRWTTVDALLSNFHLPRSTLLMMVSSFAGSDQIRAAYATAMAERYRLFSFGDAMLIL